MYYTYIIYSSSINKYYIGMSQDPTKRLEFHNSGISKFTSRAFDWIVVFTEAFNLKSEALAREKQIKKWKSRKMIEKLINIKP